MFDSWKRTVIVDGQFKVRKLNPRWSAPWWYWWPNAVVIDRNPIPTWELDSVALEAACRSKHLQLESIPEIMTFKEIYRKYNVTQGSSLGTTFFFSDFRPSVVAIDPLLPAIAASLTLWHELTHVAQEQRDPEKMREDVPVFSRDGWVPYWNDWREVEARSNEPLALKASLVKGI